MLLSIIVPTYNVEEYISNCLDSLIKQDLDKNLYEIIVINDGATDKSGTIAHHYSNLYSNVIVYDQENKGLSAARNKGIDLAKGKYIYFIDSDDYISKNTLGYITSLLENHKLDILCVQVKETKLLDIFNADNISTISEEKIKIQDGITYIATHNYLNNAWWYFIRKEYLLDTGLRFPEGRFVEDANFTATLLTSSKRISATDLDFYRYYLRPNSIMRKKSQVHLIKMIADYEKNIVDYIPLIKQLNLIEHTYKQKCLSRIVARQQSFVFFMLIRCVELKLSFKELSVIISRLQKMGYYPIHNFIGDDYNKLSYRLLLIIINNKPLLRITSNTINFFKKY